MAHIIPFTISGYEIAHVEPGDVQNRQARDYCNQMNPQATRARLDEDFIECLVERATMFAINDPSGAFWGSWLVYGLEPVGADSISGFPGPMFPMIATQIPGVALGPDGNQMNASVIEEAEAQLARFWRFTFGMIEYMVANVIPCHDGSTFDVNHFRFPSDPTQHEWRDLDPFNRYCKLDVEFNASGAAVRTLNTWKTTDPDPGRDAGSFGA